MKSKMNQKAGGKLPNLSNKTKSKLLSRFMKEKFSKKKAKELADSITKEYGGLSVLKHQYPFLSEENNTRGEEKMNNNSGNNSGEEKMNNNSGNNSGEEKKNNNSGNNSGGRRKKSLKKKSNKKKSKKKKSNTLKRVRFQALNNPVKRRSY